MKMRVIIKKFVTRCVLMVFIFGLSFSISVPAFADSEDYSLYAATSNATATLTESLIKGKDITSFGNNVAMGDAGAFFGFYDTDLSQGHVRGIISSNTSRNVQEIHYDSLKRLSENDSVSNKQLLKAGNQYLRYGKTLNEIGFDTTQGSDPIDDTINRKFLGGGLLLGYYATDGLDRFLDTIFRFVDEHNPLSFFGSFDSGNKQFTVDVENSDYESSQRSQSWFAFTKGRLASTFSDFKKTGILIAVLIFLIMIVWAFLHGGKGVSVAIKNFVLRTAFLTVGLLVLGKVYILATDNIAFDNGSQYLDDHHSETSLNASLITDNFMDFESWVYTKNLGLPNNIQISPNGIDSGTFKQLNAHIDNCANESAVEDCRNKYTFDLIQSYFHGDTVTSASFGGHVISKYGTKQLSELMSLDFSSNKVLPEGLVISNSCVSYKEPITGSDITNRYDLTNSRENIHIDRTTGKPVKGDVFTSLYNNCNSDNGLSDLAMYNYLATDFKKDKAVIYSDYQSSNNQIKVAHYSVSAFGTSSVERFFNLLSVVLQYVAFAVIAFGFLAFLVIGALKRTMQMFSATPFAFFGSIRGIGRFVMSILGLIFELLVFSYGYSLAKAVFIFVLVDVRNATLSKFGAGTSGYVVSLIGSSVFLLILLIALFKIRSAIVSGVDQGFEDLWHRWFGVGIHSEQSAAGIAPMVKSHIMYSSMNKASSLLNGNAKTTKGAVEGDESGSKSRFGVTKALALPAAASIVEGKKNASVNASHSSNEKMNAAVGLVGDESINNANQSSSGLGSVVGDVSATSMQERRDRADQIRHHFQETGSLTGFNNSRNANNLSSSSPGEISGDSSDKGYRLNNNYAFSQTSEPRSSDSSIVSGGSKIEGDNQNDTSVQDWFTRKKDK